MKYLRLAAFILFFITVGMVFGLYLAPEKLMPVVSPLAHSVGVTLPGQREVVGFFPYWLIGKGKDSYAGYLTNATYYGLVVTGDGSLQKMANDQEEEPGWTTLKGERMEALLSDAKKGRMSTSLLVFSGNDDAISEMLADATSSADAMVDDAIPIMKKYGFTDLNLDIESFLEATPGARQSMTAFVRRVHERIHGEKAGTVSIDVAPIAVVKNRLIDVEAIRPYVDRFILMAYDYHYPGSYVAGPVAPLEGKGIDKEFDISSVVEKLTTIYPSHKLILGLPLYGYEWDTLSSSPSGATIPGSGITASAKRIAGELEASCSGCLKGVDATGKQPYAAIPTGDYYRMVFYEDEASMREKIGLAKRFGLGGIALWAMGYEDDRILEPVKDYAGYRD